MNSKNKKIAAWGFIISLIVASLTIFKSDEPTEEVVIEVEVVEQEEPTQVEILTADLEEEDETASLEDIIEEHILHFTDDGILIAPYPDYENFSDAFAFARGMLGDSSGHGSLRIFLWRGEKYNTETLKQSAQIDSVEEVVVEVIIGEIEPDTTVNDSTNKQ
jgi:hypothetical protein